MSHSVPVLCGTVSARWLLLWVEKMWLFYAQYSRNPVSWLFHASVCLLNCAMGGHSTLRKVCFIYLFFVFVVHVTCGIGWPIRKALLKIGPWRWSRRMMVVSLLRGTLGTCFNDIILFVSVATLKIWEFWIEAWLGLFIDIVRVRSLVVNDRPSGFDDRSIVILLEILQTRDSVISVYRSFGRTLIGLLQRASALWNVRSLEWTLWVCQIQVISILCLRLLSVVVVIALSGLSSAFSPGVNWGALLEPARTFRPNSKRTLRLFPLSFRVVVVRACIMKSFCLLSVILNPLTECLVCNLPFLSRCLVKSNLVI